LTALHKDFYKHQLRIRELLSRNTRKKVLVEDQRQFLGDHYAYVEHLIVSIRGNPEAYQLIANYCDPNLPSLDLLIESFAYSFFEDLMNPESSEEELLKVIFTLLKLEFLALDRRAGLFSENISSLVANILGIYTKRRTQRKYLKLILKRPLMKIVHGEGRDLKLDPKTIYERVLMKREKFVKFESIPYLPKQSAFKTWFPGTSSTTPRAVSMRSTTSMDNYDLDYYLSDSEVVLQLSRLSEQITEHVKALLSSIYSNIHTMPYGVRWISKCISDLSTRRGIQLKERNSLLGTFLFIKWWLPSIASADMNGLITDTVISQVTRGNLSLISNVSATQIIKHICRGTTFEGQQYEHVNRFITEEAPKMLSYFEDVINVKDVIVGETKARRPQSQQAVSIEEYTGDKDTMRYYYMCVLTRPKLPLVVNMHKSLKLGTLQDFKFQGVVLSVQEVKLLVSIIIKHENDFRAKGLTSLVNDAKRIRKAQENDGLFGTIRTDAILYLMFLEQSLPHGMDRSYETRSRAATGTVVYKMTEEYQRSRLLSKIKEATRDLLFALDSFAIFFDKSKSCSLAQIVDFVLNFSYLFESKTKETKYPVRLLAHYLDSHLQELPEDYRENNYSKLYTSIVAEYESEFTAKRKVASVNKQILLLAINSMEKHISDIRQEERVQLSAQHTRDFISFIKSARVPVCLSVVNLQEVIVCKQKECQHSRIDYMNILVPGVKRTFTKSQPQKGPSRVEPPKYHVELIDEFADEFSNLDLLKGCTKKSIRAHVTCHQPIDKLSSKSRTDSLSVGDAFFTYIQILKAEISQHPLYITKPFEEIEAIVEEIERYLTRRMYHNIFPATQSPDDLSFYRRTLELDWMKPEHLDISQNSKQDHMWTYAIDQLAVIDDFFSTAEKLSCLVDFVTSVVNVLSLCASSESAGADDCLPIVIYLVIKARPKRMHSNLNYLTLFRCRQQMLGDAGFCFLQVKSAVEFIESLDCSCLSISEAEFESSIAEARLRHRLHEEVKV
jgi:hypothetical protein